MRKPRSASSLGAAVVWLLATESKALLQPPSSSLLSSSFPPAVLPGRRPTTSDSRKQRSPLRLDLVPPPPSSSSLPDPVIPTPHEQGEEGEGDPGIPSATTTTAASSAPHVTTGEGPPVPSVPRGVLTTIKLTSNQRSVLSASALVAIDVVVRRTFQRLAVPFPSSLGGCCALLVTMLATGPCYGERIYSLLAPGAGLLAKWLPVFFVPSLVTLPLVGTVGSSLEVSSVLSRGPPRPPGHHHSVGIYSVPAPVSSSLAFFFAACCCCVMPATCDDTHTNH
jgi:hypothetical protein